MKAVSLRSSAALSHRSPLRYPGGKTRAVKHILKFIPESIDCMVSPFVGGGSIELALANNGIRVYGYDAFSPLVEFWQCLLQDADSLANRVSQYLPLPKDHFYKLQKTQGELPTKLERAAAFYVLNRASFSGSTLSGGMSPGHPRFTESSVDRLREFSNPHISVDRMDFHDSMAARSNIFAYLDPPYMISSSLYGNGGDTHRGFDHEGLHTILKDRKSWILSYNSCDSIRALYSDFRQALPSWTYGMGKDKTSKEVLIFSQDLEIY